MKRTMLLFCCILFTGGTVGAQDFEPSKQAQGYLDAKNVTVEHSTGIFHYKVPLFSLGVGDFQLPISLDYAARGVREEDASGIVGYNWLLNTGGVVTRTIRGGIADETPYHGYLWEARRRDALPLPEDVTRVNKRERDGECDIFTVVFNGRSVNFIIKMDENCRIHADPLERTNVRIECESNRGQEINGWIVTDESGNRYIYRQKEYSVDIMKEDAISFNGVRDKTYVSSWYLNRIEPCNQRPIEFTYLAEVRLYDNSQEDINTTRFYSSYKSQYSYGSKMRERVFDFGKYKDEFDQDIRQAKNYLNSFSLEMQLNNELYKYMGNGQWVRNPNFEAGQAAINANFRIMGQVANFTSITNASNALIQTLNQLIGTYENSSSHNARMAASFFRAAKSCVTRSLDEVDYNVSLRECSSGTAFTVKSPVLTHISGDGQFIEFKYSGGWGNFRLEQILSRDVLGGVISSVRLNGYNTLNRLCILDKNGQEVQGIKFDYYTSPSPGEEIVDAWGYYRRKSGNNDKGYSQFVDADYAKIGSLERITTTMGGKMIVDYESNTLITFTSDLFGGIRIKSLQVDDDKSNTHDTIHYRYPMRGFPVFSRVSNHENIEYAGFRDNVTHSRMKYTNMSCVNTGNNGIYYPYVLETTRGKGTKAYLFYGTPVVSPLEPHAFWLASLPLGEAIYDSNGGLKELVKFKYATDLYYVSGNGYFVPADTTDSYKRAITQVKAYEYYMDEEFLEDYYRRQGDIFLYQDGSLLHYINPYKEYYLYNIKPRVSVRLPEQVYCIKYGGKTRLKEKAVYRFESQVTSEPLMSDFSSKATGTPYQKIEYFYDNVVNSSYPTRVSTTDAKGIMSTTVTKRVTEMGNASNPVFEMMKQKNILTPVVKESQLKGDTIKKECVFVHEMLQEDSCCYWGVAQVYAFYPSTTNTLAFSSLASPDVNLFTLGQTNYLQEQDVVYRKSSQRYLPVTIKTSTGEVARCYDSNQGYMILKAEHASACGVAAIDLKKYDESSQTIREMQMLQKAYSVCSRFWQILEGIDESLESEEFRYYVWSREHDIMKEVILVVAARQTMALEKFYALLDSVSANNYRYLHAFRERYWQFADEHPELTDLRYLVYNICEFIQRGIIREFNVLKYNYLPGMEDYWNCNDLLEITVLPETKRVRLFVIVKDRAGYINYTVEHSGGRASGEFELSNSSGYSLQCFDLDLGSHENVTSVKISRPSNGVAYCALVPDNVAFEATSYNLDGTVFCKFNQNGQLELNEYDAAGRLVRVKDERGNVIRECLYNVVKLN
ncbi:hypothetical protein [Butyricimonas sp. Marseille-P3923]|uniref:hypothetical protein n=1 Tax=Butyricimonas sp. Marseille-P3923 TaxID=1987504 RepID=UPI0011460D3B|nr:hypothetical protein [Butyricimonas sp. Marseille-P3923]